MAQRGQTTSGRDAATSAREAALIVVVAAMIALAAAAAAPMRALENHFADYRISHLSHLSPPSDDIIIIAIDDETLANLPYLSPINRNLLASVVERLDKAEPRVIGFDILFDRPSAPEEDQRFAEALERARAPMVAVGEPGASVRRAFCGGDGRSQGEEGGVIDRFAEPLTLGHGIFCLDGVDGVARVARYGEAGGARAFAAAILGAAGAEPPPGARRLSFRLSPDRGWPFPTYSAAQIDLLPDEWLRGKIILIGQITPYSGDWIATPMRHAALRSPVEPAELAPVGKMPGVVIHAFAIEAGLGEAGLGEATPARGALRKIAGLALPVFALVAAAGGVGLGILGAPWWAKVGAVAAAGGLYWLAAFSVYAWTGFIAPAAAPILALVLAAGASLALQERRERARRAQIHAAFQSFLAPAVVDELVRRPDALRLAAEDREISVLFTDLQGFTKLVEEIPPEIVSDTLNGYLDVIVEAVMASGGVVDKIVGDAVHALFSAPIVDSDHRRKAALCALRIAAQTNAYRRRMAEKGIALGITRIGLNAGTALVGNFGAARRLDYTAHGSTINIAARLEAANKTFGTQICASEASRVDHAAFAWREIGLAELRGVAAPRRLFELTAPEAFDGTELARYADGVAALANNPSGAEGIFRALQSARPDDALVAFQIARLQRGEAGALIKT